MVICPDCGKEVPKEKFCKNCGAFLGNIEEEPIEEVSDVSVDDSVDVASEPVDEVSDVSVDDSVDVASESDDEVSDVSVDDSVDVASESADETQNKKLKYCFNCGYKLPDDFNFCPNCGQDQTSQKITPKKADGEKNTLLAVILSVILPGLGQIYLGLDRKGAIFLIAYIISAFLIILLIGILLVLIIWIWALIDTITSANALERGEEVTDKLF